MRNNSSYYGTFRGSPYRQYTTEELLRDVDHPQLGDEVRAEMRAELTRRANKPARQPARSR